MGVTHRAFDRCQVIGSPNPWEEWTLNKVSTIRGDGSGS
jgi:hypothetical protein